MSVNFNLISASLSDEDHGSIIESIKSIEAKLPFTVTLPREQKATMPGIGIKTVDFIDTTYEYAVKNPDLSPAFIDLEEFGKDARLTKQLQVLMDHLVPLVGKLRDTHSMVGTEAYSSARSFYHYLKNASRANVPGASAIAKELGKRFKVSKPAASSSSSSSDEENSNAPVKVEKEVTGSKANKTKTG